MSTPSVARPIAALHGAAGAGIQNMLQKLAARLRAQGLRVAGAVEIPAEGETRACGGYAVRDLATGAVIPISQNLGTGSAACSLDPAGLAAACLAAERAIPGADVVILSKFGKQEAEGGGLTDAFGAALSAGLPIVTSVAPAYAESWRAFAGDLAEFVIAADEALEDWWLRLRRDMLSAAAEEIVSQEIASQEIGSHDA